MNGHNIPIDWEMSKMKDFYLCILIWSGEPKFRLLLLLTFQTMIGCLVNSSFAVMHAVPNARYKSSQGSR